MRNLRLTFLFAIAFLPIVGIAADVPTFDELKQQNASGEMFFNAGLDIFAAASNMAAVAPAYPYFRYAYEAGFEGDSRVYELLGLMQRDGIGTEKDLLQTAAYFSEGAEHNSVRSAIHLLCLDEELLGESFSDQRLKALYFLKTSKDIKVKELERFARAYYLGTLNHPENKECSALLSEILKDKGSPEGSIAWAARVLLELLTADLEGSSYPASVNDIYKELNYAFQNGDRYDKSYAAYFLFIASASGIRNGPNLGSAEYWLTQSASFGNLDAQGVLNVWASDTPVENPVCEWSCEFVRNSREFRKVIVVAQQEYEQSKRLEQEYLQLKSLERQRAYLAAQQAQIQRLQQRRIKRRRFWSGVFMVLGAAAGIYVANRYAPSSSRTTSYSNNTTPVVSSRPSPTFTTPVVSNKPSPTKPFVSIQSPKKRAGGICGTQVDCSPGLFCIKSNARDTRGLCGNTISQFGLRAYDEYNTWPDVTAQGCRFTTECPLGLSCKKTNSLSGLCVK